MPYILGALVVFGSLLFFTTNIVSQKKSEGTLPNSPTVTPSGVEPTTMLSVTKSDSAPDDSDSTWKYPNSTRIDLGQGKYYYKSSDTPEVITQWYKAKIAKLSLSLQTVVTNNSNGNISNTIKASDNHTFINLLVEKGSQDSSTKITLSIVKQ